MSFRERFKQSVKEIKGGVKALFNRKVASRWTTPTSARNQTGTLGKGMRESNLDTSVPRTQPAQDPITMSLPSQPLRDDTRQSSQMPNPIEEFTLRAATAGRNTLEIGFKGSSENPMALTNNQSTAKLWVDETMSETDKTDGDQLDKTSPRAGRAPQAMSIMQSGAKELARALEPVTNIFGPVKDMVDVFIGSIDKYKVAESARVEYEALASQVGGVLQDLARFFVQGASLTMTQSMENICGSIRAELKMVESKLGRNAAVRYLEAQDEVDVILGCYHRIHSHLQRLSLNANLEMWKVVEKQASDARSDRKGSLVDRLPASLSARYNSAEGAELRRRACTPDTRVDVLALILGWTSSGEGAVYWLNGMAGTGKTTIAYSACERLTFERKLAASFFCSRLRGECRNVNLIIPSIAYQLARFSRPFMSALSEILKQDPDVHTSVLHLQFEGLIARPLKRVGKTLPDGLVVVIDALDECDNKDTTGRMLDLLLNQAANLPIRFIISSRPEPEIRSRMSVGAKSQLVLHELDKGEVRADIKKYLRNELAQMDPSDEQIGALAERAGILFIYAATAVRYIGFDDFQQNPNGRLHTVLNRRQGQRTLEHAEIDELYLTILEAACSKRGLEEEQLQDMRQVLYTVVCAREPLTVNALSELLQINDVDRVRAALRPLWSVLHVVETTELVTTLHASFPDFLFDSTRSLKYHRNPEAHHLKLAELCFDRMKRIRSQFNICGLESSYLFDEKVMNLEERITRKIPLGLLYACRYWAAHVDLGSIESSIIDRLQAFLSTGLLLWMEVLNLNNQMKAGIECMKLIVDWCKAIEGEQDLIDLAQDAKRFVETFASNPVSQSTPHIYVSMLPFWSKSSPIARHYEKYTRGPVLPEGTALEQRQMAHLSTWAFEKAIGGMAVSPDGLSIALGLGKDVVVVDSSSGRKMLDPLRGHPHEVRSIAFSPDGACVFAGSFQYNHKGVTILGWDTRSGDVVLGPLQLHGHTDIILSLHFSPDCTRVATGSVDKTARLWDAKTGKMLYCLPTDGDVFVTIFSSDGTRLAAGVDNTLYVWDTHTGDTCLGPVTHQHAFRRVAFLPDGLHILSASYQNKTLYVWDVQTGDMILGPIEGHKARIESIGCSPDGRFIISGSKDRTICVWDAQNGNMIIGPLQARTDYITAVAFTPDGSRIISACKGGLVCTWDAQQRTLTNSSINTPTDGITCVKFISDGTHFASGSAQGTIYIWDAYTGEMRVGPIKAHTSEIIAVAVWKDRVVSGTDDGTICICDALTGKVVLGPLQVASGKISAIAYSPDGQMIATGSKDGVDGWNTQSGERVFGPLTDLEGEVLSVQFSPGGNRVGGSSGASRSNIAVWDVSTAKSVFGTLDAHHDWARSISYSPNGAFIASGSDDKTIIVWDADTGKKRLGPLTGHSHWVRSVHFSPDSTRLVSGSLDKTIRIWDVQTGEMMFELLHGHEDWITSVEYSPDAIHILSRSNGMSVPVQIHDARSPAERALMSSESEIGDWTMKKDGWVVDDQSRLLVWVPGDLRNALPSTSTVQAMPAPQGYLRLKFDKSRMGESWAEVYASGM